MTNGLGVIVMQDGDAEQDAVAGHGGCEDVAVVEIDESVQCAAGDGQEDGGGERSGDVVFGGRRVCGRVGWVGSHDVERLMQGWLGG